MRSFNKFLIVTLGLFCVDLAACAQKANSVQNSASRDSTATTDIEASIKRNTLDDTFDTAHTRPLNFAARLQADTRSGPLIYPVSLTASADDHVYISDNNAHRIHQFSGSPDTIATLSQQSGHGQLEWPNTIRLWHDSLWISDNEGIKVFTLDGSFQRLLRVFFQVGYFAIDADGALFVNPSFAVQKSSNPLIVKLSHDGTRVRGFGNRLSLADHAGLDDRVFLCSVKHYVLAVFAYRPLVQVYDTEGNFIREFWVNHPTFALLAPLLNNESFVHPGPSKTRLPQYIAGACAIDDRLLVLLDLPRPEIVEFDLEGHEITRYRSDSQPLTTIHYRGFDVQLNGGRYRFWALAASDVHSLALLEYVTAKPQ